MRHRIIVAFPIPCIAGLENKNPSEHLLKKSIKVLSQISRLRIWFPLRKFDHEMNLKDSLYLVLLDLSIGKFLY